jgi:hypothetical protein
MPKTDAYETALLSAFESGTLKSVATKAELTKFKAAARATAIKDRGLNTQDSLGDLQSEAETLYLLAVPSMFDSIKEGMAEPIDECDKDLDW